MSPDPISTVATTAASAASAWAWKTYGKAFMDKLVGEAADKWKEFKWDKAAERYREKMAYLYGTTRILGNPRPIELQDVFTDVFILDEPTAFQRFDIKKLKELVEKNRFARPLLAKRQNGLDFIKEPMRRHENNLKNHRLFILGKPGAGKTTFLKYITLEAVKGNLDKTPIFVPLKEWSDSGLELLLFIKEQFEICNFPEAQVFVKHLLESGRAIVLFDGLDEVKREGGGRDKAIIELNSFSKQYDRSQCLITCRIAATDYSFEKFTYVEVADFTDRQIRTFVKKWFSEDKNIQKTFFNEFFHQDNEGLRELGRVPLLLTLLCMAFEETLTLPQRRVEIYEEAIEALLKKWDTSRRIKRDEIYHKLSLGRKRQMLARIAAEMFEKSEYFLRQNSLERKLVTYLENLPPSDVSDDIDGEAVLKAIEAQHGIFVERARQIYSFAHLTFQEYFTAKYIADNEAEGTTKKLITNHLTDDRWREVFLLTASLLDSADRFLGEFRQAIDDLVANDEQLIEILHRVNELAIGSELQLNAASVRGVYWYLFSTFIDRDRTVDRVLPIDLTFALEHALDHNLDRALERDPTFDRALDRALDLDLDLSKDRDIILNLDLSLTEKQGRKLQQYFTANRLLVECLQLAYVTNRKEILNSILLPPNPASTE